MTLTLRAEGPSNLALLPNCGQAQIDMDSRFGRHTASLGLRYRTYRIKEMNTSGSILIWGYSVVAEKEGLLRPSMAFAPSGPSRSRRSDLLSCKSVEPRRLEGSLFPLSQPLKKKGPAYGEPSLFNSGGERGIRTLDRLLTYTPLAGARFRPLSHLSSRFNCIGLA